MKIQNSYKNLEQEVNNKTEAMKYKSWRGDLSRKGLDKVSWGDLNCVRTEVLNK